MTCPGGWLRAMAARLCSARSMERLIDPVIADLRAEYGEARRRGQTWRSHWILVSGYIAFLKVITVHAGQRSIPILRDWTADDRQALGRTIALGVAAMLAVTILIVFVPMVQLSQRHAGQMSLYMYLIPQALPIAVPVGFTLGVFCGLGGRVVSPGLASRVLAAALVCTVASFVTLVWIVPAAGDGFRASVARHVRLTNGTQVSMTKGGLELTLGELSRQIDQLSHAGRTTSARRLAQVYHQRYALPWATFALALLALCAVPRRPVGRWILAPAAGVACRAYYVFLAAGEMASREGTLSAFAGAWLPNIVFAVVSAALLIAGSCRDSARSHSAR